MTIDRLGPVDPVFKYNKTAKTGKVDSKPESSDTVALSDEARKLAAIKQVSDAVKAAPDVRMDRVEEVKAKLKDPNYMSEAVTEAVADNILSVLLGE